MQAMQKCYQVLDSQCFQKFLSQNRTAFTSVFWYNCQSYNNFEQLDKNIDIIQ